MLKLNQESYTMLKRLPRSQFERELLSHVKKFFPREYLELGEAKTNEVCQLVIDNAARKGFRSKKEVFYYLSLSYMLGCEFAKDPQLTWVAGLINDDSVKPAERIENLWNQSLSYFSAVAGDENEYLVAALIRTKNVPLDSIPDDEGQSLDHLVLQLLHKLYPEKAGDQGDDNLRNLIAHARSVAATYQIANGKGITVLTCLMFFLGSFVDRDPLYPWVAQALSPLGVTDSAENAERIQRLHSAALQYIDTALRDS